MHETGRRELRICVVGAMLSGQPNGVPRQDEKIARLLERLGYRVVAVSSARSRFARLADIVYTLVSRHGAIDVAIVMVYSGPSFVVTTIASWLARRLGIPLVFSLHGGDLPRFAGRYPRWVRRIFRHPIAVVCQTTYLQRFVAGLGRHAYLIPNVFDVPEYPYRPRSRIQPRLFWMRSFHPLYNPAMAVRVLHLLRKEFPDAILTMAGPDKGSLKETERLAQQLGLGDAIRFVGFLNFERKIAEAEKADVFINTNKVDNTPVAVLEAAAFGLPIVATAVGGIPHLLEHERTALLVPSDDAGAMAHAVAQLVRTPTLAEALARNARALALQSSPENVSRGWVRLFQETLGQ